MARLVVVTIANSVVEIYDLKTKEKVGEINVPDRPHEIVIHPRHRHLAYVSIPYRKGIYGQYVGEGYEIVTIDLNEIKVKDICNLRPNHSRPHGMQIGSKTGYLYITCESNNGEILKIDTNNDLKILSSIPTNAHGTHWLVVLPSETKAYTANKELPFVSVLDLVSDTFDHKIDVPFGSEDIGCSHDGRFVFLSAYSTSKDMSIVDTRTDTIIHRITLRYPPSGFISSPINPSLVYVRHMNVSYENGFFATDDGYLQEVNIETKQAGRIIKTGKQPLNIVITNDGKQAYLSCGMSDRIDIIDLEKMEVIGKIDTLPSPHGIAFAD